MRTTVAAKATKVEIARQTDKSLGDEHFTGKDGWMRATTENFVVVMYMYVCG